jgi:hypothetical protein
MGGVAAFTPGNTHTPILPMCRTRASSFFQNKANEIYDQFNAIIL